MVQKAGTGIDSRYDNEGFRSSSVDIGNSNGEVHGGLKGSNEYILSSDGKKILSPSRGVDKAEQWLQRKARSAFSKKMLYKRLPILRWLPVYSSEDAVGDVVAGITVGLTVIPQALAYSGIAGLPPAYGLYCSFLGCLIYIFLGSCKDVPMGPTAIASLLTYQVAQGDVQRAILLCFLSGVIQLLMGLFGLGFLIDFVSGPVSSGFTSAVSLIIITSQVKDVLGIRAKGSTFVQIWTGIFKDIHNTRLWDTVLGLTCIVLLLLMRLVAMIKIGPKEEELKSKQQKVINKILWLFGTARNAILLVICGAFSFYLQSTSDTNPFLTIGDVPAGLPTFQAPKFSVSANDSSTGKEQSLGDMLGFMGSGLIVLPILGLMENIAICKAFSNGKAVDATQELIAIGISNIANSFCQGFPGTGSLSRSAVNNASGVRTPFGNLYTSAIVILSLLFFTPYFAFIPKATLAAIIIAAVIFMVEVKVVAPMWRTKKSDLVPGLGTFICCLAMPLEVGICIGVGINMAFILYHAARPKIAMEVLKTPNTNDYLMITPDRCLIFPSADYVRNLVTKHSIRQSLPVVIDCTHIYGSDYTGAMACGALLEDLQRRGQLVLFYNLKQSVANVFEGADIAFRVFYDIQTLEDVIDQHFRPEEESARV